MCALVDTLDTRIAIGLLDRILLHKAISTEDLYALVGGERPYLAALPLGDGGFDGVLFDGFKSSLGIVASAAPRLFDIGGGSQDLRLVSLGPTSYSAHLLFYRPTPLATV